MLDAAVKQMSGKGSKLRHMPQIGILRDRGIYKKLTSQEAIQEKEQLLDAFFETLKETGNIEGCLSGMEHPGATEASRRAGAASTSAMDLHDRLNSIPGDAEEPEISAERIKEMSDLGYYLISDHLMLGVRLLSAYACRLLSNVCRNFILPETDKPCLLFCLFQFAQLIVPYLPHIVPKAHFTHEVHFTCEANFTFRASGTLS